MTSASETYLYAMPTNGMRRENWWIRGACEIVELWKWGNWDFRVGATALEDKRKKANSEMFDSIIPQFHNQSVGGAASLALLGCANHQRIAPPHLGELLLEPRHEHARLRAAGAYAVRRHVEASVKLKMESVELCCHSVRSLWRGSRRRTHFPFYTFHFPFAYFGPHQTLPEGANTNHYYWIDLVVGQANARVTFEGDGYSHLPDPMFIARAGETNRVTLLLGKPYVIHCNMPIQAARARRRHRHAADSAVAVLV